MTSVSSLGKTDFWKHRWHGKTHRFYKKNRFYNFPMQTYYILENKISDFIINVFYNQSLVYGYKEVWLKRKSHLKTLRTKTICLPHQNKFFRQTKYLFCPFDRRHPKLALIINHQNNGQIFSSRHIYDVLGYLVRYDPSLVAQQGEK